MRKANVVMLTDGTDLSLFTRFLTSLYASDFPKDHLLTLAPPAYGIVPGRNEALNEATKSSEFVLVADADIVVPTNWWEQILPIFDDPEVGAVGPMIAYCHPNQCTCNERQEVRGREGLELLSSPNPAVNIPPATSDRMDNDWGGFFWDGFMVLRSSAFQAEPNVDDFTCRRVECKLMIATKVVVVHDKNPQNSDFVWIPEANFYWKAVAASVGKAVMVDPSRPLEYGEERGMNYLKIYLSKQLTGCI